ncbi:MAG: hypothetical protein ACLQQ0_00460 [Limisphaerales bacterium]
MAFDLRLRDNTNSAVGINWDDDHFLPVLEKFAVTSYSNGPHLSRSVKLIDPAAVQLYPAIAIDYHVPELEIKE